MSFFPTASLKTNGEKCQNENVFFCYPLNNSGYEADHNATSHQTRTHS